LKKFSEFVKETVDYPVDKIQIILDVMNMNLKFKIFDLTKEKSDIHLALIELSKDEENFNYIWNSVHDNLYFRNQL